MRWLRLALGVAVALGVAAVAYAAAGPVMRPTVVRVQPASGSRAAPAGPTTRVTLSAVLAAAPFRPTRRPAAARYRVAPPATGAPATPPPPKPALALTGIVWGDEPAAVIEGLPGTSGASVVRRGDVVGGLMVKRIGRDRVTVMGLDTTWVLTVRELWR